MLLFLWQVKVALHEWSKYSITRVITQLVFSYFLFCRLLRFRCYHENRCTIIYILLSLTTNARLIRVPGVIRSARSRRLLRCRRRRRSETIVCSIRRQPKQTGSDRPAGRVTLCGSSVRRRPVRRSPVRRSPVRCRPVRSRLPIRRHPVRSRFPVCLSVRLFVHHLPVRSQDLGFAVHILPMNGRHLWTPSRNTTSQALESLLN